MPPLVWQSTGFDLGEVLRSEEIVPVVQAVDVYKEVLCRGAAGEDRLAILVHLEAKAVELVAPGGDHGGQGLLQRPLAVVDGLVDLVVPVLVDLVNGA